MLLLAFTSRHNASVTGVELLLKVGEHARVCDVHVDDILGIRECRHHIMSTLFGSVDGQLSVHLPT